MAERQLPKLASPVFIVRAEENLRNIKELGGFGENDTHDQ
jgi:hypothetical protein